MMGMLRFTVLALVFAVALMAGPVLVLANQLATPDSQNIYLMLRAPFSEPFPARVEALGAREVGPFRAPFGTLLLASPDVHNALVDNGFWVLSGSRLAAICGIDPGAAAL